jgi:hypothetical protein
VSLFRIGTSEGAPGSSLPAQATVKDAMTTYFTQFMFPLETPDRGTAIAQSFPFSL